MGINTWMVTICQHRHPGYHRHVHQPALPVTNTQKLFARRSARDIFDDSEMLLYTSHAHRHGEQKSAVTCRPVSTCEPVVIRNDATIQPTAMLFTNRLLAPNTGNLACDPSLICGYGYHGIPGICLRSWYVVTEHDYSLDYQWWSLDRIAKAVSMNYSTCCVFHRLGGLHSTLEVAWCVGRLYFSYIIEFDDVASRLKLWIVFLRSPATHSPWLACVQYNSSSR